MSRLGQALYEARIKLASLAGKAVYASFGLTDTEIYYRKFPLLREILGYGMSTHTGRTVNEATALNCSTVWACTRVISEAVAALPLHLMQETAKGKYEARDHPLFRVLHDEPNPEMSDMQFRETLTAHALTYGNGYARRVTRGEVPTGETVALWPLDPRAVTPQRNKQGDLEYLWRKDTVYEILPAWKVFHLRGLGFDGIQGYSVVTMARQSIALAQIQEEYAAKFFAAGGRRPYLLEHGTKFKTDQEFQQWNNRWKQKYASIDTFHEAPVLEGGLKYTELGFNPRDAQFLEGRQFSVPEICRWFLLTPHKVFDLTHATFSNVEHLQLGFYMDTVQPWCVRWEKDICRCLLTQAEKDSKQPLFAKHNMAAILRGDFKSQTEGYASMLQNGIVSIDEVRSLMDWNPAPNGAGEAHHIQMNMQTLPGTGEPTAVEKGALARASGKPS